MQSMQQGLLSDGNACHRGVQHAALPGRPAANRANFFRRHDKVRAVSYKRIPRKTKMQATVQETVAKPQPQQQATRKTLLCTSVTASSFEQALAEMHEISDAGADLIELRLDMLKDFQVEKHLQRLLSTTQTPKLVTMRPVWEG